MTHIHLTSDAFEDLIRALDASQHVTITAHDGRKYADVGGLTYVAPLAEAVSA